MTSPLMVPILINTLILCDENQIFRTEDRGLSGAHHQYLGWQDLQVGEISSIQGRFLQHTNKNFVLDSLINIKMAPNDS